MKKSLILVVGFAFTMTLIVSLSILIFQSDDVEVVDTPIAVQIDTSVPVQVSESVPVSERYIAQVDRVKVIFEHTNYTSYRLQTNDLVRTGDLNTERGYKDDLDATVYVLNWQQPEGSQVRYVRLSAEPEYLYSLDSAGEVIRGSRLIREQD